VRDFFQLGMWMAVLAFTATGDCRMIDLERVSAQALSDTIGAIYDCALDPQRWINAIRRIAELCEAAKISYQIISIPSNEVGYTIVEQAALFGADRVILGATHRTVLEKALKGNVVRSVSSLLPEEIQLIIFGG